MEKALNLSKYSTTPIIQTPAIRMANYWDYLKKKKLLNQRVM